MQAAPPSGPTLLGFDVIWIATMLSAVATFAVMLAIYAATTVKDPMARRVKALNERREQLKAGIVASTNKRKKLTNRNEAADQVRSILSQFKMLQDDQVKKTQQQPDAGRHPHQGPRLLHHLRALRAAGRARHRRGRADLRRRLFPGMGLVQAAMRPSRASSSAATRRRTSGSRTRSTSAATRSARACRTRSTCWSSAPRPA